MYRIESLLENGLEISKLPEPKRKIISLIKLLSKNFIQSNEQAVKWDAILCDWIELEMPELITSAVATSESRMIDEQIENDVESEVKQPEIQQEIVAKKGEKIEPIKEVVSEEKNQNIVEQKEAIKEEIVEEEIHNDLIADEYFRNNPAKVLGTQIDINGKVSVIAVKAGVDIDVPVVEKTFKEFDTNVVDVPHQIFIDAALENLERKAIEKEIGNIVKVKPEVLENTELTTITEPSNYYYTFREILRKYNPNINREELEAYLYCHPELPYEKYIDDFINSKDDLVKKGLIFYDNGKLEYRHTYLSGNIHRKMTYSKKQNNKEHIINKYSQEVYDNQIKALSEYMPTRKYFTSDVNDNNKITLLPHAQIVKDFIIKTIVAAELEEHEQSLFEWFRKYLKEYLTSDDFGQSDANDIISYYLNQSFERKRQEDKDSRGKKGKKTEQDKKEEQENIEREKRAKIEGDRLFNRFAVEELIEDDRVKLEQIWNETYNAIRHADYTKIPVAWTMNKEFPFRNKPLVLSETQREGVAYINHTQSGMLAFEVGVGKTLSALACMSQTMENNLAKYPLIIAPKATMKQWLNTIQGGRDEAKNMDIIGAFSHYPKVRFLDNCNQEIIFANKDYSAEEIEAIDKVTDKIAELKPFISSVTLNEELFSHETNEYYSDAIEIKESFKDFWADVNSYKANVREDTIKRFYTKYSTFLRNYKKYLIFSTGTMKPVPEYTITLITIENGMSYMGMRNYEDVAQTAYEIISQGEDYNEDDYTDAEKEGKGKGLYSKLVRKVNSTVNNPKLALEDLGIDYIVIDEAHKCKKIFESVKGNIIKDAEGNPIIVGGKNVRDKLGNSTTINRKKKRDKSYYNLAQAPSLSGHKAFLLATYIRKNNQNRNVVLLTATPFENSPLEVYSMMSLANHKFMVDNNFESLKDFFDTFMKIEYDIKLNAKGDIINAEVLNGYENLLQLKIFVRSVILHKTGEEADIVRPTKIVYPNDNVKTALVMTQQQQNLIKLVLEWVEFEGTPRKDPFSDEPPYGSMEYVCHKATEQYRLAQEYKDLEEKERAMLQLESDQFDGEETTDGYEIPEVDMEDVETSDEDKDEAREIKKIEDEITQSNTVNEAHLKETDFKMVKVLRALSFLKSITFSPYAFKCIKESGIVPTAKEFVESSPKIKYSIECIKSVKKFHEDTNTPMSGQIIYANIGVSLFEKIFEYLTDTKTVLRDVGKKYTSDTKDGKHKKGDIKYKKEYVDVAESYGVGFRREEVAIIGGVQDKGNVQKIMDGFNCGKIKVIIGSSKIRLGVDLQRNTSTMYMCAYDWNPTDYMQVIGRGWRQLNRFIYIRVVNPLLENSVDMIVFQYLSEKTNRLKDIWDLSDVKSQLDLAEFDAKKLQLEIITEPEKKATLEITFEKSRLGGALQFYKNKLDGIKQLRDRIQSFKKILAEIPSYINTFYACEKEYEIKLLNEEEENKLDPYESGLRKLERGEDEIKDKFIQEKDRLQREINRIPIKQDEEQRELKEELSEIHKTPIVFDDTKVVVDVDRMTAITTELFSLGLSSSEFPTRMATAIAAERLKMIKEGQDAAEKQQFGIISEKQDAINAIADRMREEQKNLSIELDGLLEKETEELDAYKKINEIEYNKNNSNIAAIKARYDHKRKETVEYYEEIFSKTRNDEGKFATVADYYKQLVIYCGIIIKWVEGGRDSKGFFESEFKPVYYKRDDYKFKSIEFRAKRGDYKKVIERYGLKSDDDSQFDLLREKYQNDISDTAERITEIDRTYSLRVAELTEEYNARLGNAMLPAQLAELFAADNKKYLKSGADMFMQWKAYCGEMTYNEIKAANPEVEIMKDVEGVVAEVSSVEETPEPIAEAIAEPIIAPSFEGSAAEPVVETEVIAEPIEKVAEQEPIAEPIVETVVAPAPVVDRMESLQQMLSDYALMLKYSKTDEQKATVTEMLSSVNLMIRMEAKKQGILACGGNVAE